MVSIASSSKAAAKKPAASSVGAPAQKTQSSRKGKRAWRKNIDIEDVEEGLEELRAEERELGKPLQRHGDNELFQIDVKGDEDIRKKLPKYSKAQLTSTKILAQRSAVPAVFSRPTSSQKRKSILSQEEKSRLLRMGKRARKGPFNSVMDHTEMGNGSAMLELSEAVKNSGTFDPWSQEDADAEMGNDDAEGMGLETVRKQKVKPPPTPHPKDVIEVPAIVDPHQGTSYNPLASAYQDLLQKAHETEEKRVEDAVKLATIKEKMAQARVYEEDGIPSGAPGMKVDEPDEDGPEPSVEETSITKRAPERKTKAQRNKAAKLLAARKALAARAARKQMLSTIDQAKTMRRATDRTSTAREQAHLLKKQLQREKLKQGLGGKRLGKHKVPEGDVDVQLGDDLSESLRALKPEGNLFKDRFVSLQQRALIEPRKLVLPKKRRNRTIEYEKHAWKRFE